MLGKHHRVGCWFEELELGELKTRLVDILLRNSRKANISSSRALAQISKLVARLTYKVKAMIKKITQKMIR